MCVMINSAYKFTFANVEADIVPWLLLQDVSKARLDAEQWVSC